MSTFEYELFLAGYVSFNFWARVLITETSENGITNAKNKFYFTPTWKGKKMIKKIKRAQSFQHKALFLSFFN